jgi:hypothetical protein
LQGGELGGRLIKSSRTLEAVRDEVAQAVVPGLFEHPLQTEIGGSAMTIRRAQCRHLPEIDGGRQVTRCAKQQQGEPSRPACWR